MSPSVGHPSRSRSIAALSLLSLVSLPTLAFAQDDLSVAQRHYERAEFDRAVGAFDRAEQSEHLTHEELEAILRGRGLAHHAAGDVGAAEEDLSRLLSIAPSASLDETTPPAVRRLLERLREEVVPIAVEGVVMPSTTGYVVSLRVTGDVGALQRGARIHYASDAGPEQIDAPRAEVLTDEATLRYWLEVLGPGGAVIASAGSETDPLTYARETALAAASESSVMPAPSDDTGLIVGVTIGVAVAVAAVAVVLAIVLAPPPDTTLSGPMRVEMP